MELTKYKIFFGGIFFLTSLVFTNVSSAASLVTVNGKALITADVDNDLFRTRAIDNALQQLTSYGEQQLDSFSIVENGQVLIDQIQLASKLGVQSYTVVKEEILDKYYYVSLNVIVTDKPPEKLDNKCFKASPSAVDFSLKLEFNKNKMPAWVIGLDEMIAKAIDKHEFKPILNQLKSNMKSQENSSSLYSVYEIKDTSGRTENLYKLYASISIDPHKNHNFFEKKLDLKVTVRSNIFRKSSKISESKTSDSFPILQKNFNEIFYVKSRKNWPNKKIEITRFIIASLEKELQRLGCINFSPEILVKSGQPFLDYGSLDGIKLSDMFLVRSNNSKKIFLQIEDLDQHETKLKMISNVKVLKEVVGSQVEVISGS